MQSILVAPFFRWYIASAFFLFLFFFFFFSNNCFRPSDDRPHEPTLRGVSVSQSVRRDPQSTRLLFSPEPRRRHAGREKSQPPTSPERIAPNAKFSLRPRAPGRKFVFFFFFPAVRIEIFFPPPPTAYRGFYPPIAAIARAFFSRRPRNAAKTVHVSRARDRHAAKLTHQASNPRRVHGYTRTKTAVNMKIVTIFLKRFRHGKCARRRRRRPMILYDNTQSHCVRARLYLPEFKHRVFTVSPAVSKHRKNPIFFFFFKFFTFSNKSKCKR